MWSCVVIQLCLNLAKEWLEKLRAELFESKTQGLKERRDENCVLDAVNQTNVCIIQVLLNMVVFFFLFFFYFIFITLIFFSAKKLKFVMAPKHRSLVTPVHSWEDWLWKPANIKDENNGVADCFGNSMTVHMQSFVFCCKLWLNKLMPCFYRVFSHDVTAAIMVFQNNETAAMLVYQNNPVGIELFSYVKTFFVPID